MSQATIGSPEPGRRQAPRLSAVALIADSLGLSAADRARLAKAARRPGSCAGLRSAWLVR